MNDDTLLVSNGTECDKFYEVLDAIAIYPELVEKIMDHVQTMIQEDIDENYGIDRGILMTGLQKLRIMEPGIGRDREPSESIFDIPMLMKKSATADTYCEANAVELLRTEIEEIRRYLSNFCTPRELPDAMGEILQDQFEKHLKAAEKEKEVRPTIYREPLFKKTCDVIASAMSELGKKKEARDMTERTAALR